MRIRSAIQSDAVQIAEVHVNSWRTTYKGIVPDSYLDNLSVAKRTLLWEKQLDGGNEGSKIFVAENEAGQIVGFVSGGLNRLESMPFDSEIYAIYLLEEYQRQGIGELLMSSITSFLTDQGYKSTYLWALEDNRYRSFYEKLGGVLTGREEIEIGSVKLGEIAFGWDHLDRLTTQK
ncbi:putative N-acetyltransferase YuaI [Paenibacillus sp. J45TS6]|uniref:GNAT family N-acetyltransferase n=1 Tax=unclassified Paenibacillus TaxID=185978 RepID=UPI001B1EF61D|nr:GNAT family N-acetyltransferase [Paenibacillus sp. J45TS6]GIP43856.1 putative N-acetyltransferase YuaI [Paenibacillus sp. J45TS6]